MEGGKSVHEYLSKREPGGYNEVQAVVGGGLAGVEHPG
jgi:hypothetical protein